MENSEPSASTVLEAQKQPKAIGKKDKRNGPLPTVEELTEDVAHIVRVIDAYRLTDVKQNDPRGLDLILALHEETRADMAYRQKQWDRNSNLTQTSQVAAVYKDYTEGNCTKEEADEEIWDIYEMRQVPAEMKPQILECLSPNIDQIRENCGPLRTAALNVGVAQLHLRGEARSESTFFADNKIMPQLRNGAVPFGKYAGPDSERRVLEFLLVDVLKYERSEAAESIKELVARRFAR